MNRSAEYRNLELQPIAGHWRAGGAKRERAVIDPYTQETVLNLKMASRDDVDAAYRMAEEVQPEWAALGPSERSAVLLRTVAIMDRRKEEILDWLCREAGSTRIKAELEWSVARAITLEAASLPGRAHGRILPSDVPGKESRVYRRPLGVVGVISPWNFPLHLSARSVAPALAVGNTVVLKPASDTPVTGGLLLARMLEEAGLPPGALSVVVGAGSEIGDAFVEHPVPAFISFTGSTAVGRHIGRLAYEAPLIKRVALELGGNAPFVVLGDADVDAAVRAAVVGAFMHQGQICMAINRIIVEAPLVETFTAHFVARVNELVCGDPKRPETVVGPVINSAQLEGLQKKIATAHKEGAVLLTGGEAQGNVLPPHVFGSVNADMEIARTEVFGPVVGIQSARNAEHALELANCTEHGLSSAVFTGDMERGLHFARRIRAGMTHINDMPVHDEANAPFGGEKNSGQGRFNGDWALATFTTEHWVTVQHEPRAYPF